MKSRRQERALQDYLNHLLSDVPTATAVVVSDPPVATPAVLNTSIAKLLEGIEQRVESPVPAPLEAPVKPVQKAVKSTAKTAANQESAERLANAIKHYRDELPARFQAIIFRVDELKLALPLHLLGGIQKREKTVTPLPGKPAWFMGLLQHEPDNIQVVNTGRYLLGKRYDKDMSDYEFIVVIGDSQWGLACHELYTTIELTHDDIRWFAAAERRPWLAGMLREQMCALINSEALTLLLGQSLKKAA